MELAQLSPVTARATTFALSGGTIDNVNSCVTATPPAPASPPSPAVGSEVLVGYQDWRNTATDSAGHQCQTSMAKRFEGVLSFGMSDVIADFNSRPFQSVTATLTFQIDALRTKKVPQTMGDSWACLPRRRACCTLPCRPRA
ncbi:MAG TPA: hypothetical protein VFK05_19380, partial [Polyangiaceae bacterium]|nr:hypothetical protein [Polyangiaceae bacterium]